MPFIFTSVLWKYKLSYISFSQCQDKGQPQNAKKKNNILPKGLFFYRLTVKFCAIPLHAFVVATFPLMQAYLQLNEDVRGKWSTVAAVWRAGCHSVTSLFPLGCGWLLLGDQLNHIPRVWSRWASHRLHHTIIPALPLSSYQGWWEETERKPLMMSLGDLKSQQFFSFLFIYNGSDVL